MDLKTLVLIVIWKWRQRQTKKKEIAKNSKKKHRREWIRCIFEKEVRRRCGAGQNLIAEMQLNAVNKYENFFRMGPEAFEYLLSLVGPHIVKVDVRREPICPKIRLGITLRYLAAGDSMVSLSYLFRVGVSTVSETVSKTTQVIWEVLQPQVLHPPSEAQWLDIANGFKNRWNFPNCIGAIDGKHVEIQAPPNRGSEFYNYKGSHSLVLMAVCDYQYKFTLVDIGGAGRQSDGGVFACSEIGKRLNNAQLHIPPFMTISEDRLPMPHILVGDEAFPLLINLLRPYPRSLTLGVDELVFNYRLSRARLVIENTFGILASRWRIFSRSIIAKVENIENIIKATVCLHNFIMKKKNPSYFPPNLVDQEQPDKTLTPGMWRKDTSILTPVSRLGNNNYIGTTKTIRDTFKDYFNEEGSVPWQWDHI